MCFRCVYVLPLLNVSGIKQNLIIVVRVQHDMVALLSGGGQPFDVLILVFTMFWFVFVFLIEICVDYCIIYFEFMTISYLFKYT